jgi:hypothetical protein
MPVNLRNRLTSDFSAAACNCCCDDLPSCEAKSRREVTRTREKHFGAYKAEIEDNEVRLLTNELHVRE